MFQVFFSEFKVSPIYFQVDSRPLWSPPRAPPCCLEVACQRELFALAWLPGARAVATMSLGDTHTRPREATAGKCQRTAAAQNNRAGRAVWVEDDTNHQG